MEDTVLIKIEDGIAYLTINRPKALNAINKSVMKGLNDFFTENNTNSSLIGVVITGSGDKAFVAGADIKEFDGLTVEEGSDMSRFGHDTYFLIENFHVPVIAAVNGFALGGGCELAMACHMRIAGDNAKFGQPEVNLGLVPGYGGTQRLVQYIGKGKALELLLTADMIKADEAHRLGLVNHVVPAGEEVAKSVELIQKIGTKGPLAITQMIEIVNTYFHDHTGFDREVASFGVTIGSEDAMEGAAAFLEKRKANFRRR